MINVKPLRCMKLLVVGFWPCLSATAQTRVDLRGPATISRGDSAKYEVMLVVPGFSVRRVAHPVRLTATCGSFDADGEYHAPASAGRCTLTAVVQDGSGRRVTGSRVIDVFEPAMDSGQATPRRGARTPKPAARAAPPIARAAPPIVLTAPPPTTTARMARRAPSLRVMASAIAVTEPLSAMSLPNSAPRRNKGKNWATKPAAPPMKVCVQWASSGSPAAAAVTMAAAGASSRMLLPR